MEQPKYKRVLLKVSGEALAGEASRGLDFNVIGSVCDAIKSCVEMGVEVGIVVGGGNFWRGLKDGGDRMVRVRADHMGMLATTINALALQDAFEHAGLEAVVMTAVEMNVFADQYTARGADAALKAGKIVIFGAGLGSPFFSTDTAAVLRAAEINADIILMAKNVDGVYSADPAKDPEAVRYDEITYKEILEKELKALDMTATTFCMENNISLYAFALKDPRNIHRVIMGENVGTVIHN